MKNRKSGLQIIFLCTLALLILSSLNLQSQAKVVEKIVAIVNDEVITKTELDERMEKEVELTVKSMEIERKPIEKAKKGDEIGLLVPEDVHKGNKVYKI